MTFADKNTEWELDVEIKVPNDISSSLLVSLSARNTHVSTKRVLVGHWWWPTVVRLEPKIKKSLADLESHWRLESTFSKLSGDLLHYLLITTVCGEVSPKDDSIKIVMFAH